MDRPEPLQGRGVRMEATAQRRLGGVKGDRPRSVLFFYFSSSQRMFVQSQSQSQTCPTHPMLQMSTGVEYLREPISTSGARYHSVTTSCV